MRDVSEQLPVCVPVAAFSAGGEVLPAVLMSPRRSLFAQAQSEDVIELTPISRGVSCVAAEHDGYRGIGVNVAVYVSPADAARRYSQAAPRSAATRAAVIDKRA